MKKKSQLIRWITFVLSCVVLTAAGLVIIGVSPVLLDFAPESVDQTLPADRSSDSAQPVAMSKQCAPPLPIGDMHRRPLPSQDDRYDNIVVDVKQDGTLHVLGEQMEVQMFKTLLNAQLHEQLQTLVTIRPDGDCLFRHVGPVISVCEQAGVPYQTLMQTNGMPNAVNSPPDVST